MGHTASIAGSPALFASVLRHAGAIVADDLTAFDDLFYIAGALHRKKIGGNRLGAISGAGFEAVGMADSIESEHFAMEMGALARGHGEARRGDPGREAAGRAGGDPQPDRHQSGRRRRSPSADHRGLPPGSRHRRGRRRPRPDRPGGAGARGEQAPARLRHQRSEEHRASDAARWSSATRSRSSASWTAGNSTTRCARR